MVDRIEKYRVLEEIGQGGMSVVYRGHDEALDRDVAVKVLHRHLARDPDARERFSREARAVARLTHHNIPEIYDFSHGEGDLSYLVTELVVGAPLSELVREGTPMLPEVGAMIVLGVAEALGHAHDHDIIHRDVKPENILLGDDGVAKLTDFGIAQIVGLESMTITGTLVGSPAHMSPEQIESPNRLDFRADIWALGTVLYACVTGGVLPFDAPTPHGVLKRIVEGRYEDPRRINPHVESGLAAVVARCLRVDREERYRSVRELGDDLRRWLADRGLTEPESELRAWMRDRDVYQEDLSRRLVVSLMAQGDMDRAEGKRHAALEHFGRVLTLEPDHPDASRRVHELHTGLRVRRLLRWGGAAVGLALVFAAAVWFWPRPEPSPEPRHALQPLAVPPAFPDLETSPVDAAPYDGAGRVVGRALGWLATDVAKLARSRPRDPDVPLRPPKPLVETLGVRFTADPPKLKVVVDGRPVALREVVALTPGRHEAVLTLPGCDECEPARRTFDVPPEKHHFRYEMPFEPTTVRVDCDGGDVYLDGQRLGPCGASYEYAVERSGARVVTVAVRWPDGRVEEKKRSVSPGGRIELDLR